jgi:hypothetical protein
MRRSINRKMSYKQNVHTVHLNRDLVVFHKKVKNRTTLLVLAVYCLLYKHMQEYRHAGLISHSCAPISGGPEAGQQPPRHFRVCRRQFASFFAMFHLAKCSFILTASWCTIYPKSDSKTSSYIQYSTVYLTISRVH